VNKHEANALCELCGTSSQASSQPESFFLGGGGRGQQGQIMEGKNFFAYSNENEGMFVLVLYSYTLIHEFIIGNKSEVLRSKAKL